MMCRQSRQKYHLGHLQTAISQARNKLLSTFQRLQSTSRHGHMVCVQKCDMGMTKKWGKSAKIWGTFKLQYLKLETSFWQTFKGYNQLLDMDIWCVFKKVTWEWQKNGAKVTNSHSSEMAWIYHVAISFNGYISQNFSTTYLLRNISQ